MAFQFILVLINLSIPLLTHYGYLPSEDQITRFIDRLVTISRATIDARPSSHDFGPSDNLPDDLILESHLYKDGSSSPSLIKSLAAEVVNTQCSCIELIPSPTSLESVPATHTLGNNTAPINSRTFLELKWLVILLITVLFFVHIFRKSRRLQLVFTMLVRLCWEFACSHWKDFWCDYVEDTPGEVITPVGTSSMLCAALKIYVLTFMNTPAPVLTHDEMEMLAGLPTTYRPSSTYHSPSAVPVVPSSTSSSPSFKTGSFTHDQPHWTSQVVATPMSRSEQLPIQMSTTSTRYSSCTSNYTMPSHSTPISERRQNVSVSPRPTARATAPLMTSIPLPPRMPARTKRNRTRSMPFEDGTSASSITTDVFTDSRPPSEWDRRVSRAARASTPSNGACTARSSSITDATYGATDIFELPSPILYHMEPPAGRTYVAPVTPAVSSRRARTMTATSSRVGHGGTRRQWD